MRPLAVALAVLALVGCAGPAVFEPGAKADYQLGGAYPPPAGVTVVARDSTAQPEPGLYSICYVNGFQSQPGAVWPADLLITDAAGEPLVDPGWPDEHILDVRRPAVFPRIAAVIETCAQSGFDAVEFDNLDSYTRSGGQLTLDDAIAFATRLVAHAHGLGLAAGQKNTLELGTDGRDRIGFDFAIVEECDRFSECRQATAVYGDAVIDIEYADDLRRPFAQLCADAATPRSTILRDRDLTTPESAEYVYERCD